MNLVPKLVVLILMCSTFNFEGAYSKKQPICKKLQLKGKIGEVLTVMCKKAGRKAKWVKDTTPTAIPCTTPTPIQCTTPTPIQCTTPAPIQCTTPTPIQCTTPTSIPCTTPTPIYCTTPTPIQCTTPTTIPCTTPTPIPCKGYFYWETIVIRRGNLITTLPHIGKEYKVAFDLEITSYGSGWHSVIHFTTGGDGFKYGKRTPAVFTYGADHFHITSAVDGNGNYYKDFPIDLQDKKSHIEISQTLYDNKYWYDIAINNVSVFATENTDAQKFDDVDMWAGEPRYPALDGILTNVRVDI